MVVVRRDGWFPATARALAGDFEHGRFRDGFAEALDALRFSIDVQGDKSVRVEEDLDDSVVSELRKRGHDIVVQRAYDRVGFGGGQVVSRDAERECCARVRSRARMVRRLVGSLV